MGSDKNVNSQPDLLDQWLGGVLQQYGDVEPRAGLEGRILANLESASQNTWIGRGWVWGLGTAALAAACVAIAFWIAYARHPVQRSVVAVRPTPAPSVSADSGRGTTSVPTVHVVAHHTRRRPVQPTTATLEEPRLQTFPSPQPLSEQEQLLAQYVKNFPQEARFVANEQTQAEAQKNLEELAMDKSLDSSSDQKER